MGAPFAYPDRCYSKILLDIFCRSVYTGHEVINMPSTKKRINLTIPDVIYDKLQEYKALNGISNDAGACLQLIVQQLNSQEQSRMMIKAFMAMSADEVAEISADGARAIRQMLEQQSQK